MWSGGIAPTERRSARALLLWIAAAAVVVVAVGFAAFFLYVEFVAQPQAGDVSSGVPCQERPPLAEVEQALQQQAALVEQLEAIGDVTVLPASCGEETDSRGEIMIFVPSKSVSDAVQEVLESDPFTVPVTIRNI